MDGNELAVVPVLQFPIWVDSLPPEIDELAARGFETVVRVPFRDDLRPNPELDEGKWLAVVRSAIEGVSDEMLLLLGAFDEVVLDDRLRGRRTTIQPDWGAPHELPDSTIREHVAVSRDGASSSRWLLFRRFLPDRDDLAGDLQHALDRLLAKQARKNPSAELDELRAVAEGALTGPSF
jgi:hypothetical protein